MNPNRNCLRNPRRNSWSHPRNLWKCRSRNSCSIPERILGEFLTEQEEESLMTFQMEHLGESLEKSLKRDQVKVVDFLQKSLKVFWRHFWEDAFPFFHNNELFKMTNRHTCRMRQKIMQFFFIQLKLTNACFDVWSPLSNYCFISYLKYF